MNLLRKIFLFLLCIIALECVSQTRPKKGNLVYFIDSVRVKSIGIFDPNKIESINTINDDDTTAPFGKVFIAVKKTETVHFLTAADVARLNHVTIDSPAIFMLDDIIIRDTSLFFIDSSYITKTEIEKVARGVYMPQNIADLRMLKIYTPEYIDKKKRK